MKTTLDLDAEILRRAKQLAAAEGVPLRAWIEDAMRARLLPSPRRRAAYRFDPPLVRGTAPPSVDIGDRDALYDLMERA